MYTSLINFLNFFFFQKKLFTPTPGYALHDATTNEGLQQALPQKCQLALTQVLKCHPHTPRFQNMRYRGSLGGRLLTDTGCNKGRGASLKQWFDSVDVACRGYSLGLALPTHTDDTIWTGWNETCLLDLSSVGCCVYITEDFAEVGSPEELPCDEPCFFCNVNKLAVIISLLHTHFTIITGKNIWSTSTAPAS